MSDSFDLAIVRVIKAMYEQVGDDLTVDDLARMAMYSKFHFSRGFRQATGVSPGRFLSALRFQEAKRLLATTTLSVAEISNTVGYSSLGTFSTRFKRFVGLSPTEYRRSGGEWSAVPPGRNHQRHSDPPASVHGRVWADDVGDCGFTFVGLFPNPVPDCVPVRSTVLAKPGSYALPDVPEGRWHLLAQSVTCDHSTGTSGGPSQEAGGSVGHLGPVEVRAGVASSADVHLRPMRVVDLPVLPAPFAVRPQGAGNGSGSHSRYVGTHVRSVGDVSQRVTIRAR